MLNWEDSNQKMFSALPGSLLFFPFLERQFSGEKEVALASELYFLLSRAKQLDTKMDTKMDTKDVYAVDPRR